MYRYHAWAKVTTETDVSPLEKEEMKGKGNHFFVAGKSRIGESEGFCYNPARETNSEQFTPEKGR